MRVVIVVGLALLAAGCQAIARADAENRQAMQARFVQLSPQQQNAAQRCVAFSRGRVAALENAGQGSSAPSSDSIGWSCLNNPYAYAEIPAPGTQPAPLFRDPTVRCTTTGGYGEAYTTCR